MKCLQAISKPATARKEIQIIIPAIHRINRMYIIVATIAIPRAPSIIGHACERSWTICEYI